MERDDNLCRELLKQHRRHLIQHTLILLLLKQKLIAHYKCSNTDILTFSETGSAVPPPGWSSVGQNIQNKLVSSSIWDWVWTEVVFVWLYSVNLSLIALPYWIQRSSLISAHWHCGSDWMLIEGKSVQIFCSLIIVYKSWNKHWQWATILQHLFLSFNVYLYIYTNAFLIHIVHVCIG